MKVRCYGCGCQYEPTEEDTDTHTHHATAVGLKVISREKLLDLLDECQRERDAAIRTAAFAADPHTLVAPLP
jgi:hypothetical protein